MGVGRRLTLEEGLATLRLAEENGLIATVMGGEKLGFICHCDKVCCSNIRHVASTGYFLIEKSRFQSAVKPELCTGCGICVPHCAFEAIEMKGDVAVVDPEKCYGCGVCVLQCPAEGAIVLDLVRPKEHIPLIEMKHSQV
jgi:NAD-dependent dihydropyrimidine dehydrogenase PreA subunit